MSWFHRLFRRAKADAELDEEVQFYLDQEAQLRIDRGESRERAMEGARRDFGNVTLMKETTRQIWGWTLVEDFVRDLRHSLRLLARSPLFTAVAVLSLALGIGANTAIFSLADAIVFRDLPVRDPGRLFQVRAVHERGTNLVHSYPLYQDIRDRNRVFSSTVCAGSFAIREPLALELPNATRRELVARITYVSGNYFGTLGVEPVIGRTFAPDEDRAPGAHPVAVISYRFWKQSLEADPDILKTRLVHNGAAYQILGVAPPGFTGISSNDDPDVWFPMSMSGGMLKARGSSSLYVFGRLKPGISGADASADLGRVYGELQQIYRDYNGQRGETVPMAKGVQALRSRFEKPLLVLLGVVGLLMLIACANLAALLLARAAARRHEISVRLSLGASRFRLVRQFLTESLLIALLGGAAGLVVSSWGASLLIAMVTTSTRRLPIHFAVDWRILAFTAAASILAAILFGLFPALQANRTRIVSHGRLPAARLLIAGQMALSLFLLIAAGLFLRSLANLRTLDTGFVRDNLLVLMLNPPPSYGKEPAAYLELYQNLTERVETLPGVRSASFSSASFFGTGSSRGNIAYEGQVRESPENEWPFKVRITPKFPETFGLSLLAGRTFTERDDRNAPQVAIVSESIAKRNFPGANPVGKRFCFSNEFQAECAVEIVGVVRDIRYNSLREASPYTLYLPVQQAPVQRGDLQVRTWSDAAAMSAQVQEAVRRYNPDVRVVHTVTLERLVEDSIVQDRLLALLSTFFAILALVLSAVGLYGITTYGVHRRTGEIGVRMALGASRQNVLWMVLREVLVLVLAGAAIGIPAALAASGIVRGLLFGLTPDDPLSIGGATVALILIALVAGYLPARRACRVDPMQALRSE